MPGTRHCMVVALLLGCWAVEAFDDSDDEQLIGWRGEVPRHGAVRQGKGSNVDDQKAWIETISWSPRAFIYHGFLSHKECDHLIELAKERLERSMVIGEKGDEVDPVRTSHSASLRRGETRIVLEIEERIALWTRLPEENGEPIEVLRYEDGQKYEAHWDWFDEKEKAGDSQRTATVLMYLSDVEDHAGGETALPLAEPLDAVAQGIEGYSECASRMGISVRPRKGDVLLFWDMRPDGKTVDRAALHASCPTFKGQKWTATKWIHQVRYGYR